MDGPRFLVPADDDRDPITSTIESVDNEQSGNETLPGPKFLVQSDEDQGVTDAKAALRDGIAQVKEGEQQGGNPADLYRDTAVATLETAGTFATGILGAITGGVGGLTELMANLASGEDLDKSIDEAVQTLNKVSNSMTYAPKTEAGGELLTTVMKPFEWYDEKTFEAGQLVEDVPVIGTELATGVKTTLEMLPVGWFLRGAKRARAKINNKQKTDGGDVIKEEVASHVKQIYKDNPDAKKNVSEAQAVMDEIDGVKFTTGQILGTNAAKAIQQKTDAANLNNLTKSERMFADNKNAIDNFADEVFGSSEGTAGKALKDAEGDYKATVENLEHFDNVLATKAERIAENFRKHDSEAAGTKLREIQKELYDVAKAKGEILYEAIGDAQVPFSQVWKKIEDLQKVPTNLMKDMPDAFLRLQQMQGKITPGGQVPGRQHLTMTEVRAVLRDLKAEQASNKGSLQPNHNKDRLIAEVINDIEGDAGVLNSLMSSADEGVVKAYEAAKSHWKNEVVDRFRKGPASGIAAYNKNGELRITDEKVIDQWFSTATKGSGGMAALKQFEKTFGPVKDSPEAWAQLNSGIMKKFYKDTAPNGYLDPSKVKSWMRKYSDNIELVPGLGDSLGTAAKQTDSILRVQKQVAEQKRAYERQALDGMLEGNTAAAMKAAIDDPMKMKELMNSTKGNVAAQKGLANEVATFIKKEVVDPHKGLNKTKLDDVLTKHEQVIKMTMGTAHYKNLKTVSDAYHILDNVKPASSVNIGATDVLSRLGNKLGISPTSALAQMRAVSQGRDSVFNFVARTKAAMYATIHRQKAQQIESEIFYDAEGANLYALLAKTEKPSPAVSKRFLKWMAKKGITIPIKYTEAGALYGVTQNNNENKRTPGVL